MSAPEDIVAAATKFLTTKADVNAQLGFTDGIPWLIGYRLAVATVEGSEQLAVVVESDGGWAGPNMHNTLRFPRLSISVWGDPLRDAGGNALDYGEVRRRVTACYEIIDSYLHRPQGETQMWSTIRTVSSVRLTEPVIYNVPDGDGMVRLQVFYAVTQG